MFSGAAKLFFGAVFIWPSGVFAGSQDIKNRTVIVSWRFDVCTKAVSGFDGQTCSEENNQAKITFLSSKILVQPTIVINQNGVEVDKRQGAGDLFELNKNLDLIALKKMNYDINGNAPARRYLILNHSATTDGNVIRFYIHREYYASEWRIPVHPPTFHSEVFEWYELAINGRHCAFDYKQHDYEEDWIGTFGGRQNVPIKIAGDTITKSPTCEVIK